MPDALDPPQKMKTNLDRKRWDRRIVSLQVGAHGKDFKETEIPETEWNMHLFRLRSPILTLKGLSRVIEHDEIRVYPPFEINRGLSATQSLAEATIPIVGGKVELRSPVTSHPTIGFEENAAVCYGLRVDLKSGFGADWDGLELLLARLRERSLQWWISSDVDPFDLGSKYVVRLNDDASFSDGPVKDDEISSWKAATGT